jgi:fatty-acyl-CoA synthase
MKRRSDAELYPRSKAHCRPKNDWRGLSRNGESVCRSRCPHSVHQNIRLNWAGYAHEAQRAAAGLRALGLHPGDRVGVWATNCAEWSILQFGCAFAGVVLVNVNPANRSHELSFVLRKSRMRALFLHTQGRHSNYQSILEESRTGQTLALEHVIYLDTPQWTRFLRDPDGIIARPGPDQPANIQYTSGTTGQPKGVLLTHVNLVNNARFFAECMRVTEEDRVCVPVPMFHCFGCVIGTMTAAVSGAACIFSAATFDPLGTLEAIDTERATVIYGVPAMFIAELQHPDFGRFRLNSPRTGIMAGAPAQSKSCGGLSTRCIVARCWSSTARRRPRLASPARSSMTMWKPAAPLWMARCPRPKCRSYLPKARRCLSVSRGELLARGYMVMKGYNDEPEATAQAVDADGWLHTGDLAIMRPDGYFRITGRARDMIIRGGENVYPREIEEFLYTHPAVADAQVIGIPDERLGEIVVAWIRLKAGATAGATPNEEEIRAFCHARLAYFKVPEYIRFVDAYPMTLSGKVQKFKMREFEIATRSLEAVATQSTSASGLAF